MMWALGLLILTGLFFVLGTLIGLVWFFASPRQSRPKVITIVAVPFGCALIPVVGLTAMALLAPVFQKSDHALYQEVFGEGTTVPEQSMLFDEFGRGRSREIYVRINPNDAELEYLFSLPGLGASESTLSQFISRGDQHGFTWWITFDPDYPGYCPSARLWEADGFRGWQQLRIAECVDVGSEYPTTTNRGPIYVIAWHRSE